MGRWVTSKGRRIYIPDEGEENPYSKEFKKKLDTQNAILGTNTRPEDTVEYKKAEKQKERTHTETGADKNERSNTPASKRNALAQETYGKNYEDLSESKQRAINRYFQDEETVNKDHYDTVLNDIRDRMRAGKITPEQAKDEAFEYEKSQRNNKKWNDLDRNRMESKTRDIFKEATNHDSINKDFDLKEKQIADNAKQREERAKNAGTPLAGTIKQDLMKAKSLSEVDLLEKELNSAYNSGKISSISKPWVEASVKEARKRLAGSDGQKKRKKK